MIQLNSRGEVGDFLDVSQFIPSRSAYECVAYSGALVKYCGAPGKGPTGTTLEASNLAQYWYGKEEGSNLASNTNGMSLQAEYDMLAGMELHYQALSSVQDIKDVLSQQGYPVLLCGAETGMYDMGLGDIVPYSWAPTGNHCIVVSGVDSAGNLLVHDCANIAPTGVRPGPRTYDASKINLVSATAVTPPWQGARMIPQGWHDDGTTLTATNGHKVVQGFRDYVLSHSWDAANVPLQEEQGLNPLEGSNPSLGAGTRQAFNWTVLEYTTSRGVFVAWGGQELLWCENELSAQKNLYAQIYAAYQAQKQQIATLQAQTQASPQLLTDMQTIESIAVKYRATP